MKLKILKASNGQYFVNLVAKNGRILMTSETYTEKSKAMRLAKSVAAFANAVIIK